MDDAEETLFLAYRNQPTQGKLLDLLRFHQDRIYNICFQVLTHPEDAEDASQEVLLEVARGINRIKDTRAFKVWLYRVAIHRAINHKKARVRRVELARQARFMRTPGGTAMDPAEKDAFMEAVAALDDRTRCLLLEHHFDKTTLEELGRREGISAVAVWKRLEKAKEQLRRSLAGAGFAVAAAGVAHALESITPTTAPTVLVTEAVLGKAALVAAGGVTVATKSVISGSIIVGALVIASAAGSAGYLVGVQRAQPTITNPGAAQAPSKSVEVAASSAPQAGPALGAGANSGPSPQQQVQDLLRQMKADWRVTLSKSMELTRFDPDTMFESLKAAWPDLSVEARQQILKAFSYKHPRVLDVLDLGMQEIDGAQGWAVQYLKSFAFRNFTNDDEGYREWRAKTAGRAVDDVRRESARDLVARFGTLTSQDAEQLGRFLRDCARGNGVQFLTEAGLPAVLERRLVSSTPAEAKELLEPLREFSLDEAYMRRTIVPYLNHSETVYQALGVLGRKGNDWAVDVILPHMQSENDNVVRSAAMALAEIGDRRVVPLMIDLIGRTNTQECVYGIGHYGLRPFTGVEYDKSHDGAWWAAWWQKNQGRFVGPK